MCFVYVLFVICGVFVFGQINDESTPSRPLGEVKLVRARLGAWWVTGIIFFLIFIFFFFFFFLYFFFSFLFFSPSIPLSISLFILLHVYSCSAFLVWKWYFALSLPLLVPPSTIPSPPSFSSLLSPQLHLLIFASLPVFSRVSSASLGCLCWSDPLSVVRGP